MGHGVKGLGGSRCRNSPCLYEQMRELGTIAKRKSLIYPIIHETSRVAKEGGSLDWRRRPFPIQRQQPLQDRLIAQVSRLAIGREDGYVQLLVRGVQAKWRRVSQHSSRPRSMMYLRWAALSLSSDLRHWATKVWEGKSGLHGSNITPIAPVRQTKRSLPGWQGAFVMCYGAAGADELVIRWSATTPIALSPCRAGCRAASAKPGAAR